MANPTPDYILGEVLMHDHTVDDISDIADKYVKKSGDTMTGTLQVNSDIKIKSGFKLILDA